VDDGGLLRRRRPVPPADPGHEGGDGRVRLLPLVAARAERPLDAGEGALDWTTRHAGPFSRRCLAAAAVGVPSAPRAPEETLHGLSILGAQSGHGLGTVYPSRTGSNGLFRASQGRFLPEDRRSREIDTVGVVGSKPIAPPRKAAKNKGRRRSRSSGFSVPRGLHTTLHTTSG